MYHVDNPWWERASLDITEEGVNTLLRSLFSKTGPSRVVKSLEERAGYALLLVGAPPLVHLAQEKMR